jgi:UDP-N-acetylmuramate dehydrogenase
VEQEHDVGGHVLLHVAAGEGWDPLVALCVSRSLAGIEALSGIPGTVGAVPIQNVGAYGQQVAESIAAVHVYDRRQRQIRVLTPAQCGFSYRRSAFAATPNRYVILGVTFRLVKSTVSRPLRYAELCNVLGIEEGAVAPLTEVRQATLALRRSKGMVLAPDDHDTWSVGSFFKNPIVEPTAFEELQRRARERFGVHSVQQEHVADGKVKLSAAQLIERAGFERGYPLQHDPLSPVATSTKHALALTNRGAATTCQLVALAHEIAQGVHRTFGVRLAPEPVFVGMEWSGARAKVRSPIKGRSGR